MGWLSLELKKVIFFDQSDVWRKICDIDGYVKVVSWCVLFLV